MSNPAPEPVQSYQPNAYTNIEMMLAHLLRRPDVFIQVIDVLRTDYFDPGAEGIYMNIWVCASQFFKETGRMISPELMYTRFIELTRGMPQYNQSMVQHALTRIQQIFQIPDESLLPEEGIRQINQFIVERRDMPTLHDAMTQGAARLMEFLEKARTGNHSTVTITHSQSLNPFDTPLLGVTPRTPTGVMFIDLLLNGGPRLGEAYGVIAESGGGKTTLSNQMAISCARSGMHTGVFTYEEPITSDYLIPVYACAAGLSRSKFENLAPGAGVESLAMDDQVKFNEACVELKQYLQFFDMSGVVNPGGNKGPSEIEQTIIDSARKGRPLKALFLDWFWPMFTRYESNKERTPGGYKPEDRVAAQNVCDNLKAIARRHGCFIFVSHQLAAAEAGSTKKKNWNDAAEFKSFAWMFHGCFVVDPRDSSDICRIHLAKGRNQKRSSAIIQLDGEYARFKSISDDMVWCSRQKKYIEKGKESSIPDPYANTVPVIPEGDDDNLSGIF